MKRQLPAGLVIEGNVTHSALLRLPAVAARIGPIKSTDIRVGRRFSNLLGSGYPVAQYTELKHARALLVRIPDASIPRLVNDLCQSGIPLSGVKIVFIDTWASSECGSELRARGAAVATLVPLRTVQSKWFIAEGDAPAVREIRELLRLGSAQALEVREKRLAFAAEALAGDGILPMLNAARQAFRESGLSGRHVQTLVRELADRALIDFVASSTAQDRTQEGIADSYLSAAGELLPDIASQLDTLRQRRRKFSAPDESATLK